MAVSTKPAAKTTVKRVAKKTAKAESIEVLFEQSKETPGAVQYKEVVEEGAGYLIGTIYLRKDVAEAGFGSLPQAVKVTVEVA